VGPNAQASRSTAPTGRSGLENTAFFHVGGTSFWLISLSSSGFAFTLRRDSAGRRFTASSPPAPGGRPQRARLAEQREERAHGAVAAGEPAAHLCLRLAVAGWQQLVQQPHRRLDLGARPDLGLQRPKHRRRVQVGAGLGDQVQLARTSAEGPVHRTGTKIGPLSLLAVPILLRGRTGHAGRVRPSDSAALISAAASRASSRTSGSRWWRKGSISGWACEACVAPRM
jgi:hypothetical protein